MRLTVGERPEGNVLRFDDIPGSEVPKRALEVALSGGHPIVLLYQHGAFAIELVQAAQMLARDNGLYFDGWAFPVCPCGFYNSMLGECTCKLKEIRAHCSKLARDIDQFDIVMDVMKPLEWEYKKKGEKDEWILERIQNARSRMKSVPVTGMDASAESILKLAMSELRYLDRARTLRVASTIASMEACDVIQAHHLCEAVQYWSVVERLPIKPRQSEVRATTEG